MQRIFTTMKLTLGISLIITLSSYGQQQIENPGFELWEEVGFGPDTLEPVDWSSLKTSDGGAFINEAIPVVWEQSNDAHSGLYSIKLINMPILTLVAPGTLTNGRVHAAVPPTNAYVYTVKEDPQWNTPFTDTPDSLVVWAKYFPQMNDIAHAIAILHTDTAKVFDSTMFNWVAVANIDFVGESNEWTRFSVPFNYLNTDEPEYILLAVFAGDAQNALAGSYIYLDDFELIYNNSSVEENIRNNTNVYFSSNELIIESALEQFRNTKMELIDCSGRIIMVKDLGQRIKNKITVDIAPGIYFCHLINPSFDFTQKLIKR